MSLGLGMYNWCWARIAAVVSATARSLLWHQFRVMARKHFRYDWVTAWTRNMPTIMGVLARSVPGGGIPEGLHWGIVGPKASALAGVKYISTRALGLSWRIIAKFPKFGGNVMSHESWVWAIGFVKLLSMLWALPQSQSIPYPNPKTLILSSSNEYFSTQNRQKNTPAKVILMILAASTTTNSIA